LFTLFLVAPLSAADPEPRPLNRPGSFPQPPKEPYWPSLGPVQPGFERPLIQSGKLLSEHFWFEFDPKQLTEEQAYRARDQAEQAYRRCAAFFQQSPKRTPVPVFPGPGRIHVNLTPQMLGFAGLNIGGYDIRVRYLDVDYLGISAEYLFTHEIAHTFTKSFRDPFGPPTPLFEGIADHVAAAHAPIPIQLWMGQVFQKEKLWFDPDGYFITGEYDAPAEDLDGGGMLSIYAIEDTFVQYVIREYGWKKFLDFELSYRIARKTRLNNTALKGTRWHDEKPDPEEIRAVFPQHLGITWNDLRDHWLAAMAAEKPPLESEAAMLEQLIKLARTRGMIEIWQMKTSPPASPELVEIKASLLQAARSLNAGYIKDSETARAWAELKFKLLETQHKAQTQKATEK
jgi:hypothetical protein